MSAQLLDTPAPPQQKRAQRPTVELIGDTGYAIRILEDKGDIDTFRPPSKRGTPSRRHIRREEMDRYVKSLEE